MLDADQQYALADGEPSPRHKVLNNLPGSRAFCPLVHKTHELTAYSEKALDEQARAAMGPVRPDLMARAAAFLLLNDSKSSFAIEGERRPASAPRDGARPSLKQAWWRSAEPSSTVCSASLSATRIS